MASLVAARSNAMMLTGCRRVGFSVPIGVAVPRADTRVKASTQPSFSAEELSAQLTDSFNKSAVLVKEQWDKTSDTEKPAAVAITLAAVVAQVVIAGSIAAVEKVPLLPSFLELVGVAVTAVFLYNMTMVPESRASFKKSVDTFMENMTGSKSIQTFAALETPTSEIKTEV